MTEFVEDMQPPTCGPCGREMELIRGPVGADPVWRPKVWFCEGCYSAVDVAPAVVPVDDAGPVAVSALPAKFCLACADDDEVFAQRMSPICGRRGQDNEGGGGRWYLTHWYCAFCERLECLDDVAQLEVVA